jgi:hypothetical protein
MSIRTALQLKVCSPETSEAFQGLRWGDLPSFTQNLMQARCSILPFITDETKHEIEKKNTLVKAVLVHSAVPGGRPMH